MADAISVFYYIFNKIYNFIFNKAYIEEGVSVGWVFVTVVIFGLIIKTLLNVPTGLRYGDHEVHGKNERGFYK